MLKVPPLPPLFSYNTRYRLTKDLKPHYMVDFIIPSCSEFTITDRHIETIEIDVVDKDGSIYKYFGTTKVWVSIEDLRKYSEELSDGHIIGRNQ